MIGVCVTSFPGAMVLSYRQGSDNHRRIFSGDSSASLYTVSQDFTGLEHTIIMVNNNDYSIEIINTIHATPCVTDGWIVTEEKIATMD